MLPVGRIPCCDSFCIVNVSDSKKVCLIIIFYFIIKICLTDLILLLPESGQEAVFFHGIKKTVLSGHSLLKNRYLKESL